MIIDSIMQTTFTISYQRFPINFLWNGNLLLQTNQINDVHYSSFNAFLIQLNKLLCSCKKKKITKRFCHVSFTRLNITSACHGINKYFAERVSECKIGPYEVTSCFLISQMNSLQLHNMESNHWKVHPIDGSISKDQ